MKDWLQIICEDFLGQDYPIGDFCAHLHTD